MNTPPEEIDYHFAVDKAKAHLISAVKLAQDRKDQAAQTQAALSGAWATLAIALPLPEDMQGAKVVMQDDGTAVLERLTRLGGDES